MLAIPCLVSILALACSATPVPDLDPQPLEIEPKSEGRLEARQAANFGPRVHMGPTKSGADIIGLSTVFKPGYPPANPTKFLALWPGVWNPYSIKSDLVQSVISSHDQAYMTSFCGAKRGQWCLQPYVLSGWKPLTIQNGYAIDGSDEIEIIYEKATSGKGTWKQSLTNLSKGKKYPEYSAGSAAGTTFETGTEMQGSNRGSADTQVYRNLTLTLRVADPTFARTYSKDPKVVANAPVTPDGGKTWVFDQIEIPAMLPGTTFKPAN
ncbi:hypothetical protein P152DRAFT_446287 [Eremomyces bilateralis CBS 781.70]|uniref:Concanavalin A-like lectin/glucanase n=1 Tax=Eremomyces bilateralis CBS 781.70 TaxID=1392243 RepID=A0A6G1GF39_9PEZI|nr:uncharacterized protein P152DRAFT_446287 [Eremomyces bilateralis CBS 781.70]KAF1816663.1 hypothetical protein P152DRAFT_446287 [Eremomyces bilateralis CBS 781.70]